MSHRVLESVRRHRSRLLVAVTLLLTAAAALVAVPPLASASAPVTATQITVGAINTPSIDVPATDGAPQAYVVRGVPFTVDFSTDAPLSTTKATTVILTVATGPSADRAVSMKYDVPANATSGTFGITSELSLPAAGNDVTVKIAVDARKTDVAPGTSNPFDVLKTFVSAAAGSTLTGIGGGGGEGVPCNPTVSDPTCGDLQLPGGAVSNQLLSQGSCAGVCTTTSTAASVLQLLVAVDSTIGNGNPITFVAKCDKSVCPGKGIKTYSVKVQLTPGGPIAPSTPCDAKGVIPANLDFCTDYVQSTRDGAGDVLLYVLLAKDARVIY
jgi:hypothetical protein